jgi:hypothetical protein
VRTFGVVTVVLALAACFSKPDRVDGAIDAPMMTMPDGAPLPDASDPTACNPALCDGVCASDGFCEIQGDSEAGVEKCPRGKKCRFMCASAQCKGGVDCRDAAACEVSCIGTDACKPGVDCGMTPCEVICDGESACKDGIRAMGNTCTASCCGTDACKGGIQACTRGNACQ